MKDLFGQAIWDFYYHQHPEDISTETSISEIDILPVAYLFRDYAEMSVLEQKALQLATGHVLDVGAGAGSHSLYLQNNKNLNVTALDISPRAIEICKERGVKNTVCTDLLHFKGGNFDSILLLMNGTGIFESLEKIDLYLQKLYSILADSGQILVDSTDIIYMYDRDAEGAYLVPADSYYGELDYFLYYKGEAEVPMKWLYLDFNTLKRAAENNGFKIENILQEEDSYLARLTKV